VGSRFNRANSRPFPLARCGVGGNAVVGVLTDCSLEVVVGGGPDRGWLVRQNLGFCWASGPPSARFRPSGPRGAGRLFGGVSGDPGAPGGG